MVNSIFLQQHIEMLSLEDTMTLEGITHLGRGGIHPHCLAGFCVAHLNKTYIGQNLLATVGNPDNAQVVLAAGNLESLLEGRSLKVAQKEGRAAFLDHIGKMPQGKTDIGSTAGGFKGNELADDSQNMGAAFLGRDKLLYLVAEEYHAHLVVVGNGAESDGCGHLGYQIALELLTAAERIASAHVDKEHYR